MITSYKLLDEVPSSGSKKMALATWTKCVLVEEWLRGFGRKIGVNSQIPLQLSSFRTFKVVIPWGHGVLVSSRIHSKPDAGMAMQGKPSCRSKNLSVGCPFFWKAVIEMSSIDLLTLEWRPPKSSRVWLWVKTWSFWEAYRAYIVAIARSIVLVWSDSTVTSLGGSAPTKNPLDMFSKDPEATETYLFLPIKIKESAWKHSKNLNMCWIRHYTIYIIYVLYIYTSIIISNHIYICVILFNIS